MSNRQRVLAHLLEQYEAVRMADIADALGLTKRQVRTALNDLRQLRQAISIGRTKTAVWVAA